LIGKTGAASGKKFGTVSHQANESNPPASGYPVSWMWRAVYVHVAWTALRLGTLERPWPGFHAERGNPKRKLLL